MEANRKPRFDVRQHRRHGSDAHWCSTGRHGLVRSGRRFINRLGEGRDRLLQPLAFEGRRGWIRPWAVRRLWRRTRRGSALLVAALYALLGSVQRRPDRRADETRLSNEATRRQRSRPGRRVRYGIPGRRHSRRHARRSADDAHARDFALKASFLRAVDDDARSHSRRTADRYRIADTALEARATAHINARHPRFVRQAWLKDQCQRRAAVLDLELDLTRRSSQDQSDIVSPPADDEPPHSHSVPFHREPWRKAELAFVSIDLDAEHAAHRAR